MLAALPMYDLPELRVHTDALWTGLAARLRERGLTGVPSELNRPRDLEALWRAPDLLLTNICGIDVVDRFAGKLDVVATPRSMAAGCSGYHYRSAVVVRGSDRVQRIAELFGARLAINSYHSHSGCGAWIPLVARLQRDGSFFDSVVETGAHGLSLRAVTSGAADVAAIDCHTWQLFARHRPSMLHGLHVVTLTEPAPAPPWVTAGGRPHTLAMLREAVRELFLSTELAEHRAALLLDGVAWTTPRTYETLHHYRELAARYGYTQLDTRQSPWAMGAARPRPQVSYR